MDNLITWLQDPLNFMLCVILGPPAFILLVGIGCGLADFLRWIFTGEK
jgi:hypothetical protein